MLKRILALFLALFLYGCPGHYHDDYYLQTAYEPVIIDRADLDATIRLLPPRQSVEAGSIYRQGSLLFLNEKFSGLHVIDNSNPSDPRKIAFLEIPGNLNLSMHGDLLYCNHASDLVTLRYHQDSLIVVDRNAEVFPELTPPDVNYIPHEYSKANRPENTVIINWIKK